MARSALLIGTGAYDDAGFISLRATEDVPRLAAVLGDPAIGGFEVRASLLDLALNEVKIAIWDFLKGADWTDEVLLYLSCHGVLARGGRLHFATRDTQVSAVEPTALEAGFLKLALDQCRARTKLLILDCCHSGAFARDALTKGEDREVHVEQQLEAAGSGTVILTASDELERAIEQDRLVELDPDRAPSVFTDVLIEGLRTGRADHDDDGEVTAAELFRWTYKEVRKRAPSQTPVIFGEQRGDVVIARNPQASALPGDVRRNAMNAYPGIRRGAAEQLSDLAHGADARAAEEAKKLLATLRDDPDADVASTARAGLGEPRTTGPAPSVSPRSGGDARLANLVRRGDEHRLAKRYARALTYYEEALAVDPDAPSALLGRGVTLRRLHRFSEARRDLDRAVELSPGSVPVRVARGELLVERGQTEDALDDLAAALRAEPDSTEALVARGRAMARSRPPRWEEALDDFDLALLIDPHGIDALVNRALALSALGRSKPAREAVDRALALDETATEAWQVSARLRLREGDLTRAVTEVEEALRLDERNLAALILRGRLRLMADDLDAALADFEAVLAIVPDAPAGQFGQARILLRRGELDAALEHLERVVSLGEVPGEWPDAAEVRAELGSTLVALQRPGDALPVLDEALRLDASSAVALGARARAHMLLDQPEQALVDYGGALASGHPDASAIAAERTRALAALKGRAPELWPADVVREVEAARDRNRSQLAKAPVEEGWQPEQLQAIQGRVTGTEQLLWLTRCRHRDDIRRHVVMLVTSQQLVWCRQKPVGAPKSDAVSWEQVREVRGQVPAGFRLVLHSGPRLDFVALGDQGLDLSGAARQLDADGVRAMIERLVEESRA
jgi:tetratricopeptide (TPR) repeat protein